LGSISLYLASDLLFILPLLLSVAFVTLLERKILAVMQMRRGPNVLGFWGLLQPFADGVKLLLKETIIPYRTAKLIFVAAPGIMFVISVLNWLVIPFSSNTNLLNLNNSVMYLLALSSLNVYALILAGWSSNSNYALLGALRAVAQMISYEVCLTFVLFPIIIFCQSFNLNDIVVVQRGCWFIFAFFYSLVMFLFCIFAETARTPFDLPEAEGELVAGYNVEYSAFQFALFFLAEYSNIVLMSCLSIICFGGGWGVLFSIFWFCVKVLFIIFLFVWVRATLPRYRYDQLMGLGWKYILVFSISIIYWSVGLLVLCL
jgi:NADH-quinone oxidoreductase subunit H